MVIAPAEERKGVMMTGLKIWRSGEKEEKTERMHVSFLRVRWSERTPLESFHS